MGVEGEAGEDVNSRLAPGLLSARLFPWLAWDVDVGMLAEFSVPPPN